MKKHYLLACLLSGILLAGIKAYSQDPNFHIYLCFGQSNMEGQGTIETHDKTVDSRFQVMEAVACSNLGRTKGTWYTAVPPLCRCYSGLSPADYFGKIMVANLPAEIKVGVVNVSVAGCKIELFDKDNYQDYVSTITEDWLLNIINAYNGDPYGYLVEVAKLAQNEGVIKGILMHQGESNTGDNQWPSKVKAVYDNLINDLALNPDSVPLLAGEVVHADQGGVCASMNSIIASLPQTIPNSYIISSAGCTDAADNLHFNSAGYRELGKRYGLKMLSLMGKEITDSMIVEETQQGTELVYFEAECDATIGENWDVLKDAQASNGSYVVVKTGIQSINEVAGSDGIITIPFSVKSDGNFNVFARLNCATADDDSYWIDMDDAGFTMVNGLVTSGWQWVLLNSYELKAGAHTYSITYREDGARIDKICISNYANAPTGIGDESENICVPDTSTVGLNLIETIDGFTLGQNYPNPFNGKTTISFIIPEVTNVSLKVYNTLGVEIADIVSNNCRAGEHTVEFDTRSLVKGIYFYTLKAHNFSATRKMVFISK